jgi:transposase-like protein
MSNPFRYFNSSPEVIRLVVMMYVRYPLSLRNVEEIGNADRREVGRRLNNRAENSHQPFRRRTGDAKVSKHEDAAEVQRTSRPGPQPFQSGAPSRHEASLQAETAALAEWRALVA